MDLPVATVWGFTLLLFRTTGLLLVAPLLGVRTVPAQVRLALGLVVAFAVYAGAGAPPRDRARSRTRSCNRRGSASR